MDKLYVVATVKHIGDSNFFGDVILITSDKAHAKTVTYHVKEHRPIPGLDYEKLVVFDDAMYFERELNKIDVFKGNCDEPCTNKECESVQES